MTRAYARLGSVLTTLLPGGAHITGIRPSCPSGFINEGDGRQIPIVHLDPEMTYGQGDRAALHGRIRVFVAGEGPAIVERIVEVEAIDRDMGFRPPPGLYAAWKGHIHGSVKGGDFLDGELVENVTSLPGPPGTKAGRYATSQCGSARARIAASAISKASPSGPSRG